MNGMSVKSCTVLTVQCEGAGLLTIEGMASLGEGGALHALQEGFMQEHGLQCGFCTPGMITRAYRLLQENPQPHRRGSTVLDGGESVPLHRLSEHRQGNSIRGRPSSRGAPARPELNSRSQEAIMSSDPNAADRVAKLEGIGCARSAARTHGSSRARACTSTTSKCLA